MRILVTGKYDQEYNRVKILLTGLKKQGISLVEFPYLKRNRATREQITQKSKDCDLVLLPSFTHLDVPFIKKIVSCPVVFDPLISKYLSKVFDYKTVWKYSPRAYKNFLKDKRALINSDLILADTQSHKEYYCIKFRIDPEKINVVPIGVNTEDFFPKDMPKNEEDTVNVGFYGSFIPLHGIDRILLAASELADNRNIEFNIYGDGILFEKITGMSRRSGLDNIKFKGYIKYENLNDVINEMDICLGIFGESLKTELVIPNKIYHYAACRKPVITRDTKGIREIFTPGQNIILSSNDPHDIAEKIKLLAGNIDLRAKIAMNAYTLISEDYNEIKITQILMKAFNKVISQ